MGRSEPAKSDFDNALTLTLDSSNSELRHVIEAEVAALFGQSPPIRPLTIPTRFAAMTVASQSGEDEEFTIVAHLGDQAIEVAGGNADSLDGLHQMPEGDLVLLVIPSSARGVPSDKFAILVTGPKSFAVVFRRQLLRRRRDISGVEGLR